MKNEDINGAIAVVTRFCTREDCVLMADRKVPVLGGETRSIYDKQGRLISDDHNCRTAKYSCLTCEAEWKVDRIRYSDQTKYLVEDLKTPQPAY